MPTAGIAFQDELRREVKRALTADDPIKTAVLAVELAIETGFGLRNIVATVQARRDDGAIRARPIRDAYLDRAVEIAALNDVGGTGGHAQHLAQLLGDLVRFTESFAEPSDWDGLRERIDRGIADYTRAVEAGAAS